jgi:hypothetical protein
MERVPVPPPIRQEEERQWAEALAHLHYALGTIVEHRGYFIPGEALDELKGAWPKVDGRMQELIRSLASTTPQPPPQPPQQPPPPPPPPSVLEGSGLLGEEGKIKRLMLGRSIDAFFARWNAEPKAAGVWRKIRQAAIPCLEIGATVMGSFPGYERVEEAISVIKHLIGFRLKRPD